MAEVRYFRCPDTDLVQGISVEYVDTIKRVIAEGYEEVPDPDKPKAEVVTKAKK